MTRVDPFLAGIPEMSDEKVQQCLDFAQKIREATRQQSRARVKSSEALKGSGEGFAQGARSPARRGGGEGKLDCSTG